MAHGVKDCLGMEGADCGRARAGDVAEKNAILDVAGVNAAGLKYTQQFRR